MSTHHYKIKFAFVIAIFIYIIIHIQYLYSCDDTIFALITASNPTNEFVKTLNTFFTRITVLGTTLKLTQDSSNYEDSIESIMKQWLEITTKYGNVPPVGFENDPDWNKKFHTVAYKLGKARIEIKKKNYKNAHDEILSISNYLFNFFEHMNMSKLQMILFKISKSFALLDEIFTSKFNLSEPNKLQSNQSTYGANELSLELFNQNELYNAIDTIDKFTNELKDLISSDTIQNYNEFLEKFSNVKNKIEHTKNYSYKLDELYHSIKELNSDYQRLRAKILFVEWFSKD